MRALIILAVSLITVVASADIIYVNPGGSIQTALDAAAPGDTVLINDGVYNEAGITMKPGVKLRGTSGDTTAVIIDAGTPPLFESVFILSDCGDTTEISGLTITRGTSLTVPPYDGAGMWMQDSDPVIHNVMITECSAMNLGGGMYLDHSSPTLTHVTLRGNASPLGGGGIACRNGSNPSLENCTFMMNSAGSGGNMSCDQSSPRLDHCAFHGGATQNNGDGMYLTDHSSPTLTNVSFGTMQCNLPGSHGQCIFMEISSSPTFTNVSFSNSGLGYGELLYTLEGSCSPTFSCCNIYAWGGNSSKVGGSLSDPTGSDGNISEDPLYCDAVNWDLSVDAASPNLPGSPDNECGVLIGCYGQGCDSPVEETSWGAIKAMYR